MGDDNKDLAGEAKGFSQEIVATLGLVELILGGVALYGAWLILRERSINVLFPSTGNTIVDIGLQLFAAALLGKIIYLIVALPIGWTLSSKESPLLVKSLEAFYGQEAIQDARSKEINLIELALTHLSIAEPAQRMVFERHRFRVVVSYGTCILILIFFCYLFFDRYDDTPRLLFIALIGGFFVFAFLGFLEQRSLFSEVTQALISLHKVEQRRAAANRKKD